MATYKIPRDSVRINVYLKKDIAERLNAFCEETGINKSAGINMIIKSHLDGQEALRSMGNLTDLMKVFAKQTGIDMQPTPPKAGDETAERSKSLLS